MQPAPTPRRLERFDALPLVALLLFWAVAGLGGALTVADAEGEARHLLLGVVTLPALAVIGIALGRCLAGAPKSGGAG